MTSTPRETSPIIVRCSVGGKSSAHTKSVEIPTPDALGCIVLFPHLLLSALRFQSILPPVYHFACGLSVLAVSCQRCISRQARCASNRDALESPILNTALPFDIASLPRYSYRPNIPSSRVRIFTAEGRSADTRLALSTKTSLHPAVPRSFGPV